jgi:hypothetical protein
MRLALTLVITAIVCSFLDPQIAFDARSAATFVGFLFGLIVIVVSVELPGMLVHRRMTGELGRLRALPWSVPVAALFVVVSRIAALEPGYLWGLVIGVVFMRTKTLADEGRGQALGAVWTFAVSLAAWFALAALRGTAGYQGSLLAQAAETGLASITVGGLEAIAIGLMPFQFMPGWAVYKWNRPIWAVLFAISVFTFFQVLIGPTSGYLSELSLQAWLSAMGVFAAFGLVTVLFWAWFRFRPVPGGEEGAEG